MGRDVISEALGRSIVIGLVLGVVAAAVVWYLERFEVNRYLAEVDGYLSKHSAFEDFLDEKRKKGGDVDG